MHALQHTVLLLVDARTPLLRWSPPRQKDDTFGPLLCYNVNHLLRELLPSVTGMRVGFALANGEACVEQEHATISPWGQQSSFVRWRLERLGIFGFQQFVDVGERRRSRRGRADGEAQAMGLVGTVIRVLAEDDDLDCVKRSMFGPGC